MAVSEEAAREAGTGQISMKALYSDPAVRQRLIEFLGADRLDHATAAYLTHSDGCGFDRRDLRPPGELNWLLDRELDIARSLADSASLLLHLDVEYVNFDSPAETLSRATHARDYLRELARNSDLACAFQSPKNAQG